MTLAHNPAHPPASAAAPRLLLPGRRLLVLQNPGRGSRNCLTGIIAALARLKIATCILELQEVWSLNKTDPGAIVRRVSHILVEQNIGAVLSYGFNGIADIPLDDAPVKNLRSFFEVRSIPHLMLWIDHPQWHADSFALGLELQGLFRSANCIHLLKSSAHALELERMAGWPNCFELPVGVDPQQFPLAPTAELAGAKETPEFDLVAICGEKGAVPPPLRPFVSQDDPDPAAIRAAILPDVQTSLEQLWSAEVPQPLRADAIAMGRDWAQRKAAEPFRAACRHWPDLIAKYPGICWYLTLAYPTYIKATKILWRLREWERHFYLAYLARFFRVGVFGGDFSAMNLGPGGWVDFLQQSRTYARGKLALSITDGHDEEGVTLKAFEIAASGVPMLHYHTQGLSDQYDDGREIAVFKTPRQAREKLAALLADKPARLALAAAARDRTLREHTWENRLLRAFALARLPVAAFRPDQT